MRPRHLRLIAPGLLALGLAACGESGPGSSMNGLPRTGPRDGSGPGVTALEPAELERFRGANPGHQLVYAPAYSHVYTSDEGRPFLLAATLSIRNLDPDRPIVIDAVRYHNSAGKLIREPLPKPVRLAPLAASEFFVAEEETGGGSGAGFVVEVHRHPDATAPLVQTVLIGTARTQGISFVCDGRVIRDLTPPPTAPLLDKNPTTGR